MKTVGRHSTPLDGVAVANGHSLTPLTIPPALQVTPRGPVSGWPQEPVTPPVKKTDRWRHARRVMAAHRGWLAAVPIVLVNAVAFAGQLAFLRTHLPWPLGGQVLVAVTLESVAVYLAWQAHLALAADDSALRLRLAAYGFAAVIGVMNYSHWMAPGWRPTFAAITFGLMSLSSPWLWSVHSRRVSRDALKAKGLIEPHAVRLGGTRWAWHPVRSVRVMSDATWTGETDPAVAVAGWQPRKTRNASPVTSPEPPLAASPDTPEGRHEDISGDGEAAPAVPSPDDVKPVRPKPRKRTQQPSARARALAILKAEPGVTDPEVMKRLKTSKSTVERARKDLAKETP